MKNKFLLWGLILYLMITIVSSIPFFFKHFSDLLFLIPIYVVVVILAVILIFRFDFRRISVLNHHLAWILPVVVLAILNIILYPQTRVDPGTAPDALIQPAVALFRLGNNPYSVTLAGGAPISPGPGWIVLNAVFSLSGLITLLTPVYLMWAGSLLAKWSKAYSVVFMGLLFLSLGFLQMSVVGHDLAAISLSVVALTLMLHRNYQNNILFIVTAVLNGLVATSRAPFIIIPIAMSLCLLQIDRRRAIQFGVLSTGLALVIHLVFYLWAAAEGLVYQPLHVFSRAAQGTSMILLGIGVVVWIGSGWLMWRRLSKEPASWLFFLWVILAIPFIIVGFGELISTGIFSLSSWSNWEGKGYVLFTLPLLIASIVIYAVQESHVRITADVNSTVD